MTINEACEITHDKFAGHIFNDVGSTIAAPFFHICKAHEGRLYSNWDVETHQGAIEQVAADFNNLPTSLVEDLVGWVATW